MLYNKADLKSSITWKALFADHFNEVVGSDMY